MYLLNHNFSPLACKGLTNMSEPSVYIIDDDLSVRNGLTRLVKTAGINAESFESAGEFLSSDKCREHGCIILDVHMPEMTGPELQEKLIEAGCSMPIIFLSAHGDVPTTAKTIKNGAVDFLEKPVDLEDLMTAIRVSLEQDQENRVKRAEYVSLLVRIKTLTPREHEVMTFVITGRLNKQIAAEMDISEETVKIHRGRVMHKLGLVSVAELVRICEKAGIPPADPRVM
jgi:FixJ family two-component response regulator